MPRCTAVIIGNSEPALPGLLAELDLDVAQVTRPWAPCQDSSVGVVLVPLSYLAEDDNLLDAVRQSWPEAEIVPLAQADHAEAASTAARLLGTEAVSLPLVMHRARPALERTLERSRRRQRHRKLIERVRALDTDAAQEVEALAHDYDSQNRFLEEATRLRSAVIHNISHEIRTPITVMQGLLDVLTDDLRDKMNEDQLDLLERVRRSSQSLLDLIQGVLDLSKAEAGVLEARPSRVYFPDLIADQIRNTGVLLRDKPVRLAVDVPRGIEWLSVDGARLRQVLASLLSNAAKFTAGGEIRVAARLVHASPTARASDPASLVRTPEPEGDILEISIADTGRGISPSDQQLIFEAFRQVDPSSTRIHEGIGIGLAIVREMSRLLGASIDLESTAGEGTKFSLRLPVTAVEGPAGRSAELGRSAVKPREPRVRDARGLLPELAQLLTASAGSRADAVAFTLDFLDRILRPEVTFFAEPAGSGWKISDVVDHAGHGLVPGGSPPLSSETLEELPTERRAIVDDPRGEGEPSWSAVAVPGERGRPSGVLAICMRSEPVPDPESLRLLEVVARWLGLVFAYERLGEVRDEIIASVGRELKNPLGALLAYTQVLLRGLRGPLTAEQRPVALRLERTLHRAILSALDLLDFRRIESRGLEVEQRPFSLAMVIDHVLSRHGAALELGGYRIGREIAAGLPQCLGDEIRTDRALSNLLRAVIERLPDGSELGIRASAAGHEVSCELSAVVTETAPFVETLAGERRPIEVTPTLGLRLARAWIETQGGQVELAAHSGIVIRFSLPSAPPDEPQGV